MNPEPDFDLDSAHRFFSGRCFNRCWGLMGKPERTAEEDEQLVALAHASHFHWTERVDVSPKNLAIAYWLLARVYAVVGRAPQARHYGSLSLAAAQTEGVPSYFVGCAHEALARAAHVAGDSAIRERETEAARRVAARLSDPEQRSRLVSDLDELGP